jgi:hypothetical protein
VIQLELFPLPVPTWVQLELPGCEMPDLMWQVEWVRQQVTKNNREFMTSRTFIEWCVKHRELLA